jgi:hypothetical protein
MTLPAVFGGADAFQSCHSAIGAGGMALDRKCRLLVTGARPAYTFTRADPLGSVTSARR